MVEKKCWVCLSKSDMASWLSLKDEFYRYKLPKDLSKRYSLSSVDFLYFDESELKNIKNGDLLITLCTPTSANDSRLNSLIEQFLALSPNVLAIILAGVPNAKEPEESECFPEIMRSENQLQFEPIAANVKINRKLALEKIIATLLNIPLRVVTQRETRYRTYFLNFILALFLIVLARCTSDFMEDRNEIFESLDVEPTFRVNVHQQVID